MMYLKVNEYGMTSDGVLVHEYSMTNDNGSNVSVLTYGGTISKIIVPDKIGVMKNIVAGFDSMDGYISCPDFIGAAIGRSADRIKGASFCIDDVEYNLDANDGDNNLHGGGNAFDKKVWEANAELEDDQLKLNLHYLSPDLEGGFPGNLDCNITYCFDNNDTLKIKYECTTDQKTVVNMTNHSYFNLSGDFNTKVTDHVMTMKSDEFVAIDEDIIPEEILHVEGTPFDFRKPKAIGRDIDVDERQVHFGAGYDHAFVLNENVDGPNVVVCDPKTGRKMEIRTQERCVVFYSGNLLKEEYIAYDNTPLHKRAAFCLETQYYPDAINAPFIKSRLLEPNEVYKTETSYKFCI